MALTLEQFAAQTEYCRITCVAGFRGLQREVNSFSIVDTPEIVSWLRGGELVVDAGFVTAADPALQKTLVGELSRRGCAGLGVKLHRYYDEIPAVFLKEGDRLDFPVFELPYETRFCDLAFEIHRSVFAQRMSETQRISDVYVKLVHTVLAQKNTDRTLYEISSVLHAPVLLTGENCELLALESGGSSAMLTNFLSLTIGHSVPDAETAQNLLRIYRQQRFGTHQLTLTGGERTLTVIAAAIDTEERLYGFLLIPECAHPLEKEQYRILESIQPLLALYFIRSGLNAAAVGSETNEFVSKVLLSSDTPISTIQYLCTINGFDYNRRRICLNISPLHFEQLSFSRRSAVRDLLQTLTHRLAEQLSCLCHPVFFSGTFVIFLLAAPDVDDRAFAASAREAADIVLAALEHCGCPTRIGISACSLAPEQIPESFRQAIDCVQLGERLMSERSVHTYTEMQIYRLLSATMTGDELRTLYAETVEPLRRFDLENNGCYVDTLETYLKNRFNVTKTAGDMHVHRNTMIYQLDKIRELLPIDIENSENILKLQMGVHAMRLLEHPAQ